jgi:hypothetical protein
MHPQSIVIERRYRGPLHSANGGYTAGLLARSLDGGVEVTLRLPPPLDTRLDVSSDGRDRVLLLDGQKLIAEARPADPGVTPPSAPSFDALADTEEGLPEGWGTAEFGECFSCGTRAEADGLGIHPRSRDGIVAARWVARDVSTEVVWAAIDCSGAYALVGPARKEPLLARMTARIERLPGEGERCVVIGWSLGDEGRKLHAGTALVAQGGEVLAASRQLWIEPRSSRD